MQLRAAVYADLLMRRGVVAVRVDESEAAIIREYLERAGFAAHFRTDEGTVYISMVRPQDGGRVTCR